MLTPTSNPNWLFWVKHISSLASFSSLDACKKRDWQRVTNSKISITILKHILWSLLSACNWPKTRTEERNLDTNCRMEEACANKNSVSKTEYFRDLYQKKYKCFILYAFILISICEFFYLIFTSDSDSVSRKDYLNIISRFLNRTGHVAPKIKID